MPSQKWRFVAETTVIYGHSGNDIALFAIGEIIIISVRPKLPRWHNKNPIYYHDLAKIVCWCNYGRSEIFWLLKMISYLKGIVAGIQNNSGNRYILTLEVNGVGYDLQVPARLAQQLPDLGSEVQIFTHYQIREEVPLLYGFGSPGERDLFRHLLSVSGIGAALAIALLDALELPDLVQAIITANTQLLIQAPGVGKKTAERLCLELKSKLIEWRKTAGFFVATGGPAPGILEEVQMTLLALGYTANEVSHALHVVSEQVGLSKDAYVEDWIKQAITHLTTEYSQ